MSQGCPYFPGFTVLLFKIIIEFLHNDRFLLLHIPVTLAMWVQYARTLKLIFLSLTFTMDLQTYTSTVLQEKKKYGVLPNEKIWYAKRFLLQFIVVLYLDLLLSSVSLFRFHLTKPI